MFNFILHHTGFIFITIVVLLLIAVGSAVLEAYLDFKSKPTEAMFWCSKHGYFRKVHTLPLFPELGGAAENSHICPMCYKAAVFDNIKVK